tara:strand:+ start:1055 stop:1882 length:828 start_codon:yes stop_codon:yes gene_type:complete
MPPRTKGRRPYRTLARKNIAAKTIQRAWRARKAKRYAKPRHIISKNPLSSPNVYNFCRSYAYGISIGVQDVDNLVYMNTDNKFMIVKLRTKVDKLPEFNEFRALFNQYKVTSIHHNMIPYYKDNIPYAKGDFPATSTDYQIAIPNFQMYYIPENFTLDIPNLQSLAADQIDKYLNESQRKAYRMFPSKQKHLWNKKPSIPDVAYEEKAGTITPTEMITAPWLSTENQDVELYGLQLLIARVDRQVINSHQSNSNIFSNMGWRINNTVYFKTRKVQ